MALIRSWFRPKVHPETGDLLSPSERFSWKIQGVIRRWTFVFAYTGVSWWWWYRNGAFDGGFWHDPTLAHWNVVASLGALQIESAVGIVVIRQMVRDRKTLKAELKEIKESHDLHLHELSMLRKSYQLLLDEMALLRRIGEKVGVE